MKPIIDHIQINVKDDIFYRWQIQREDVIFFSSLAHPGIWHQPESDRIYRAARFSRDRVYSRTIGLRGHLAQGSI